MGLGSEREVILTDREIQAALEAKQVTIDPLPRGDAYSATSVDLTLGPKIRLWKDEQVRGIEAPLRVRLVPGCKICQLIFEMTLGTPDQGYAGVFHNQRA